MDMPIIKREDQIKMANDAIHWQESYLDSERP